MAEEIRLAFTLDDSGAVKVQNLSRAMLAQDKAVQSTNSSLRTMTDRIEAARSGWQNWLVVSGISASLSLVREGIHAITSALNLLSEGDRLNRIEQGFRGVALAAGQASSDMMRSLKEATDFKMEETDLQMLATRFRDAGLAGANMGKMLEWAWDKARERGEDLGALTQKMLVAASTGETRSLGVYGMVVDSIGLLKTAAKEAGVPVEQLTEAERRLLIQTSMLAQITGEHASVAEGLGSAYARAKASLGDFGSTVRQTLAGALPGETASVFRDAFAGGDLLQTWERMPAAIEQARAEMDRMTGYMQAIGALSDGVNVDLSEYGDLIGKNVRGMAESTRAEWLLALQELHRGYGVLATDAAEVSSNAAQLPPVLAAAQGVTQAMADRTRDAASNLKKILEKEANSETSILTEEQRKQAASLVATLEEQSEAYQEMDAATRYTTAHVADLEAQIERLGRNPGTTKQRAELEALVKAAKDAQKPMYDVMRALEGMVAPSASIGLARQILGESGTPEELVAIAAATQDVATASKAMQDAIAKGDPTVAAERMQALTAAIDEAERSMATVRDRSPAMGQAVTQAMQEMRDRAADLQLAMQATGMSAEVAFARMRDAAVAAGNAIMTGPLGGYIRMGQALVAAVGTGKPADQPKPVRSGGGGGAAEKDISDARLQAELALLAAVSDLERAEAKRTIAYMDAAELRRTARKRELAETKADLDYIAAQEAIRADRAKAEADVAKANSAEIARRRKDAEDAARAQAVSLAEYQDALMEQRVLLGQMTEEEMRLAQARRAAMDPSLTGTDRLTAELRVQIAEQMAYRAQWERTGETIRGAGDAISGVVSTMDELGTAMGSDVWTDSSRRMAMSLARVTEAAGGVVAAIGKAPADIAAAAGQSSMALGSGVAGMMDSIGQAAAVMALWSAATAGVLAFWNPAEAARHAVAAAGYGLVAALVGAGVMGGGGGSSSRGSARTMGTAAPARAVAEAGTTVVVNVQGSMYGSASEMGTAIGRTLEAADRSGRRRAAH